MKEIKKLELKDIKTAFDIYDKLNEIIDCVNQFKRKPEEIGYVFENEGKLYRLYSYNQDRLNSQEKTEGKKEDDRKLMAEMQDSYPISADEEVKPEKANEDWKERTRKEIRDLNYYSPDYYVDDIEWLSIKDVEGLLKEREQFTQGEAEVIADALHSWSYDIKATIYNGGSKILRKWYKRDLDSAIEKIERLLSRESN